MSYKLIIAEKPSVAKSIAKVVGASTPHMQKANGYIEGNGYRVTWAFGHLIGLNSPEAMGFPSPTLPILPETWETHVIESSNKDLAATTAKQVELLGKMFKEAEEIIVATDAGREGELIFRYIYEYLKCKTPFRRLWISSLTDEAIRDGMVNLKNGYEMDNLSAAAHSRGEADYLVGFNASRALRIATNYKGILSLGRVQTPVLCMICDRYLANKNFVPTPFWQISALVHKDMTNFEVLSKRKYNNEKEAKDDEATVNNSKQMRVVSVEKKQVTTTPPLLYDITTLQRAANSKYGFTAEETLSIVQGLYEKKYMSYPRTGSRYIPEDVFKTIPGLIRAVGKYGTFASFADELEGKKLCRKSVDNTKVTDHHALLPTNVVPSSLTGKEKQIYEMVAMRLFEAFGENSIADRTSVELDCAGIRFVATGSVIVKAGWKKVSGHEEEKSDNGDEKNDKEKEVTLPVLKEGETLPAGTVKTLRKTDNPPAIYTDNTLLSDMETCGKKIEDEELREAMKDVGLGTPATRAATIEILIKRNYIARQGKKIIPSELGMTVASLVKGRKIADVATTGEWEKALSEIEQGKAEKTVFDKRIRSYVLELIDDIQTHSRPLEGVSTSIEPTRTCPCCGKPMLNQKFSITCNQESGGCGFKISREIAGKKLPLSAINTLAEGKETSLIKGFKSKSGKPFDAKLKVDREQKKVAFSLGDAPSGPSLPGMVCPCCGNTMTDDKWKLACECGFKLFKTQGGVALKEEEIRHLLSGDGVHLTGMLSKAGKKYNATLKVNTQEKKIDFTFDKKRK